MLLGWGTVLDGTRHVRTIHFKNDRQTSTYQNPSTLSDLNSRFGRLHSLPVLLMSVVSVCGDSIQVGQSVSL